MTVSAVVLCALTLEYRAVREQLIDVHLDNRASGTYFETGTIPGTAHRIALANPGEGDLAAGVIAERALSLYRPEAILFVGVAGSLKADVSLGDLVIATKVYAYQGGKANKTFAPRPAVWQGAHNLEQIARHLAVTGKTEALFADSPPQVHFKPIASGDVVVADRTSSVFRHIARTYGDAAAVEMEGTGTAFAAHLHGGTSALIVRGISDNADPDKSPRDAEGWQEKAAERAAKLTYPLKTDF